MPAVKKTPLKKKPAAVRKKKNDGNQTLSRQWEILKLLSSRAPGKSALELMQGLQDRDFDVEMRTVQRDMSKLIEIFPIVTNDSEHAYRWYWVPSAAFDLPGLALPDALSLHMVEHSLRTLVPRSMLSALEPRFQAAKQKLESLGKTNRVVRWTNKVRAVTPALPRLLPKIANGVLEEVQEALLLDMQLAVNYQAASATAPKLHQLNPLALVQRGAVIYLIATIASQPEKGPILWSLHRMSFVEKTYVDAVRPKDFDLDEFIAQGKLQFGSGKPIRLKARISKRLADELAEARLSEDQSFNADRTEVTATVADTWQLHWWILSKADEIVVLAPTALRRDIEKKLRAAVGGYADKHQIV